MQLHATLGLGSVAVLQLRWIQACNFGSIYFVLYLNLITELVSEDKSYKVLNKLVAITEYLSYSCWSYVGDLQTGQTVSIGDRCDYKYLVEHEVLHALGFYHEQSRTDRDDYVKIWWDQITEGNLQCCDHIRIIGLEGISSVISSHLRLISLQFLPENLQ